VPRHSILILDDEANIISSLSRLLRADGREIYGAASATEALEKLKELHGVDVVVSDNKLPNILGIDFLIKVKQLYPDTVRILITGYPDLESTIKAINNGHVYRFITKPWENEELKLIIKQALDYGDVLKDNRALLKIAKEQAELLATMKRQYPQISKRDFDKTGMYIIDEQRVSETVADFLKKYYPDVPAK
jgi:response regulator RpfG family c-di-GMP phosphodiesterase